MEGVFIEPSSTPLPDLSLQISPPNASSSSSSSSSNSSSIKTLTHGFPQTNFDLLSNSDNPRAHTDLSLGTNNDLPGRALLPPPLHHLRGVSGFDVSDRLRPIKGIPVYHNRPFPFLAVDQKDHRYHHHHPPHHQNHHQFSSFYPNYSNPNGVLQTGYRNSAARFNNGTVSVEGIKSLHSNSNAASSSSDVCSHGMMMRSRFLQKLPPKRSMRAPRMRWTTSLHARFVHAVEHLGGHESKQQTLFLFRSLSLMFEYFFIF